MEWVSFLRWGTLKMHNFSLLFIFHLVQEKLFHFKWFETCLTLVYGAPLGERRGWLLFPLDSWEAWDSCLGVAATLIECPGHPTLSSFLKTQISKSGNRQSQLPFSHFLPPIPCENQAWFLTYKSTWEFEPKYTPSANTRQTGDPWFWAGRLLYQQNPGLSFSYYVKSYARY